MPAMNVEWFGFAAAFLTSLSFVPQAVMTIRTRNTRGISRGMYLMFTVGVAFWLYYGIALGSWPMIAPNSAALALGATIGMTIAQALESKGQVGATHMGTGFDAWYPGYIDYAAFCAG